MGCCLSNQNDTTAQTKRQPPISSSNHTVSKSPPRAEEEAVKEVLSETPNPILHVPSEDPIPIPIPNPSPYYYTPVPKINHSPAGNGFPTAKHPPSLHLHHHHHTAEIAKFPPPPLSPPSPVAALTPDQISEVSEISCLSETVSTATAGDAELRLRVPITSSIPGQIHKPTSFSNDPALRRERMTGKSPLRRPNHSPRPTAPDVVTNRVSDGHRRREFGENSGRRSRSPVTRNVRSITGQSPSARKTGISPGRVRMVQSGSSGDACGRKEEKEIGTESLENPLVSLECFIFL